MAGPPSQCRSLTKLLITLVPSKRSWTKCGKIINGQHLTNSYILNSGIAEPNLIKILHDVQKLSDKYRNDCQLTCCKLRYSNPFSNASVPNERRSSYCGRVATQLSYSKLQFNNPIHSRSTNAKSWQKSTQYLPRYSVLYADFCRLVQKGATVTLTISDGVTGPMLIKFAHNVATVLPLNIF